MTSHKNNSQAGNMPNQHYKANNMRFPLSNPLNQRESPQDFIYRKEIPVTSYNHYQLRKAVAKHSGGHGMSAALRNHCNTSCVTTNSEANPFCGTEWHKWHGPIPTHVSCIEGSTHSKLLDHNKKETTHNAGSCR